MTSYRYYSSKAVYNTWRQFAGMEGDSVVVCESLDQTKMFWTAYKHFFDTDKQPRFQQLGLSESKDDLLFIKGDIETYGRMRSNLNPLPNTQSGMVHCIIGEHHSKGIPDTSKAILESHLSSYDLGDSRDFQSLDQLIDKLTRLRQSRLYFGSICSWSRIAGVFNLEVITI